MISLAIVGCGKHSIARIIPQVVESSDFNCLWVADPDLDAAQMAAKKLGSVKTHSDWRKGIDEQKPEAIIVVASPDVHFAVSKEALMADIHVMTEKPPCIDIQQMTVLAGLAKQKGLATIVGHNLRHSDAAVFASDAMADDAFGRVSSISISYHASNPRGLRWSLIDIRKAFLLSHFIHALDYASFLTKDQGFKLEHVTCNTGVGVSVHAVLSCNSSDATVSLMASNDAPHFDFRALAVGDARSIVVQSGLDYVEFSSLSFAKRTGRFWKSKSIPTGSDQSGYLSEVRCFANAIRNPRRRDNCRPNFNTALVNYRVIADIEKHLDLN
ncbi:Gfo/Idh/MocA family oxidoreductase [uncultured Hoeflea sp.]|uniref:Gfo/Idh/MocA family protein n=1 Tax=uncultured Hoeflea sp. TaxID=538666 RepID=UPI0030DAFD70